MPHRLRSTIHTAVLLALSALPAFAQSPHSGLGAILVDDGVSFRVWAPNAEGVHVRGAFNGWSLDDPLVSEGVNGMWSAVVPDASAGDSYKFFITNTDPTPPLGTTVWRLDPHSRLLDHFAEDDANSVVYDPEAYAWQTEDNFEIPPRDDLVIYELHIGSFEAPSGTPATFQEATARLDQLVRLGVNAVEVMPVHESPVENGWGYDAELIFAIDGDFGGPDAFKAFVDACHARGLAVIVDVVHNHAHLPGNDLWNFDLSYENDGGGIYFFDASALRDTPFGPRYDYTQPEVREFLLENVRMYLDDFRVDGFRFDATGFQRFGSPGEIPGAVSLLQEINTLIDTEYPGTISIAEDFNADQLATRAVAQGGLGFDTEWESLYASVARVLAAETDAERDLDELSEALTHTLNGDPFNRVIYAESHDTAAPEDAPFLVLPLRGAYLPGRIDQVDPESDLTTRRLTLIGSVLAFTAPGIPMIFMGQEVFESGVFDFPSPPALDWSAALAERAGILEFHRDLIGLRRDSGGASAGLRGGEIQIVQQNDVSKVIAYLRTANGVAPDAGGEVLVVVNLSATDFTLGYLVGVPRAGDWNVLLNTERSDYDPAFSAPPGEPGTITAELIVRDGLPARINIPRLRPHTALILSQGELPDANGILLR